MTPTAARATVILLSFAVLAMSAALTSLAWSLLAPLQLQLLPRGMLSLLAFVTAYYLGANLILWKTVVRISSGHPIAQRT
jgi:hypothetical protein